MANTERQVNGADLSALRQSFLVFWQERKPRERGLLISASAAVVLALIHAVLIGPALDGRGQLEKNLPPLRQQAAELQVLSKQAAQLARANATPPLAVSKEGIETSLTRKGLKPQSVVLSGELTRVQLVSVSFSAMLDWLDEMHKKARLSVVDANIVALPPVDTVNATLTLRQQKNGGNIE